MEHEKLILEKLESLYVGVLSEKSNVRDTKKFNKLIKELEAVNKKGDEDVSDIIAMLKRERDLKEGKTYDESVKDISESVTELLKSNKSKKKY